MKDIMMKKLLVSVSLLLLVSLAAAGSIGDRCNYRTNGDEECDPDNGVYCINNLCTQYTENPDGFCSDTDGTDSYVQGTVYFVYRNSDGEFIEGSFSDACLESGRQVGSCSPSRDCILQEFVCSPSGGMPYSSQSISCTNGCSGGKCIDADLPDSWVSVGGTYTQSTYPGEITGGASDEGSGLKNVELSIMRDSDSMYWNGYEWVSAPTWKSVSGLGEWVYAMPFSAFSAGYYTLMSKATDNQNNVEADLEETKLNIVVEEEGAGTCDYANNGDDECDTADGFYCIGGVCTQLEEAPLETSCIDSDGMNFSEKGEVEYYYRDEGGTIFLGLKMDSCSNDTVKEYFCLSPLPSIGKVFGWEEIACEEGCFDGSCGKAGDDGLPASVSDTELLEYIEKWSKGELGGTEEENDNVIQMIIEIWKESNGS